MNNDDNAYGIFGVIIVIGLICWGAISNSQQQQKETNTATIASAVSDINSKIDELYSSATNTRGAIDEECSWQTNNLSGNIGDVCANNTVESYSIGSESEYRLDEASYTSILDSGTSIDGVVSQLVNDANTNYDKLLSTTNNMVAAMNIQCDWIDSNIDSDIASQCRDASNFDSYSGSPFSASDYIEAQ